jgi:hypothetical protein
VWAVRTSQEIHHISATEPNRLVLCGETAAVCCENRTEHIPSNGHPGLPYMTMSPMKLRIWPDCAGVDQQRFVRHVLGTECSTFERKLPDKKLHVVPNLKKRRDLPPVPHTSSWRAAELTVRSSLTFTQVYVMHFTDDTGNASTLRYCTASYLSGNPAAFCANRR